jgi:hypothetical protein
LIETTEQVNLALKFLYDGATRHVDNCTIELETKTIIGFEMRKNGKFSYKVKRYSYDKIFNLEAVEPFVRSGPKVGLPNG